VCERREEGGLVIDADLCSHSPLAFHRSLFRGFLVELVCSAESLSHLREVILKTVEQVGEVQVVKALNAGGLFDRIRKVI
jgi:hypothetical protein